MSRLVKSFMIILVVGFVAVFLFAWFNLTLYIYGIRGVIIDKETNMPICDASVICFDKYYPLIEIINLGGPNSKPYSLEIVKTDNKGRFKLKHYFKLSLFLSYLRETYIYKTDYYPLRYTQESSFHINEYQRPNAETIKIPLRLVNKFHIRKIPMKSIELRSFLGQYGKQNILQLVLNGMMQKSLKSINLIS